MLNLERKFLDAKARHTLVANHRLAAEPLSIWVLPSDRHLPSALICLSMRELLAKPFLELVKTRGIGEVKLDKIIRLVERALHQLEKSSEIETDQESAAKNFADDNRIVTVVNQQQALARVCGLDSIARDCLCEEDWRSFCAIVKPHGFDWQPIGRFAASLDDLPRGIWSAPLENFLSLSTQELSELPGYGGQRINSVIEIVVALAKLIGNCPTESLLRFQVYPASINKITNWINQVLGQEQVPDRLSFCQNFVLPLLGQLEIDLGSQVAAMIECRIGADGNPQTLQEVAEKHELTRERVRQLTGRAPEVMHIRWPEGKHLLDDFYEKFRAESAGEEQVALVRRTLDHLFDFQPGSSTSRENVIEAWEAAGRRKETPMSEMEIRRWLGGSFPGLEPEIGLKWIAQEFNACELNGNTFYFGNDELDRLLHELYRFGQATALSDLVETDDEGERNLRSRIIRDLRFTEDEDNHLLPTELCGFMRDSGRWHVALVATEGRAYPKRTMISLESLIALAMSGLVQAGIVDVTVWGFHRYLNERLSQLFHAQLRPEVTPIVLAEMVARQPNGAIRPMRRRRLRWDDETGPHSPRGKLGWIDYVVQKHGVPIVLDELAALLAPYYQDYATYVLAQLTFDRDEEGGSQLGAVLYPGIPHKISPIVVPDGWQLDLNKENVSDDVKLAVARTIVMIQEGTLAKSELEHVPWFLHLIERHSYGADIWTVPMNEANDDQNEGGGIDHADPSDFSPVKRASEPSVGSEKTDVDELLSRFL